MAIEEEGPMIKKRGRKKKDEGDKKEKPVEEFGAGITTSFDKIKEFSKIEEEPPEDVEIDDVTTEQVQPVEVPSVTETAETVNELPEEDQIVTTAPQPTQTSDPAANTIPKVELPPLKEKDIARALIADLSPEKTEGLQRMIAEIRSHHVEEIVPPQPEPVVIVPPAEDDNVYDGEIYLTDLGTKPEYDFGRADMRPIGSLRRHVTTTLESFNKTNNVNGPRYVITRADGLKYYFKLPKTSREQVLAGWTLCRGKITAERYIVMLVDILHLPTPKFKLTQDPNTELVEL